LGTTLGSRKYSELHYSRIIPEVQVYSGTWTPPKGVLGQLVTEARSRAAELRRSPAAQLAEGEAPAPGFPRPPMAGALRRESVAVIAEVKRRSPSKGLINEGLSAGKQTQAYVHGGAAAVSVLTEPSHFGGSISDLSEASAAAVVPLLRKDFIVDPVQLTEARGAGASAVLLIARALAPAELATLAAAARSVGLEFLVEVRSEEELDRALALGARMIGVNNRDLETLVVDPTVCDRLIPLIPRECIAVAESGIRDVSHVGRAASVGADAVLVGSSISAASDPAGAVRALTGVRRIARGS
jgi:indole-3-glycerol phosphate synthase